VTNLSVNLNRIATLRNTRTIGIPSVTHAARLVLAAGAQGITVHPRPDQRHIRPSDVADLAELLKGYPGIEFNIEGNPFHTFIEYAERFRPAQTTLVPDSPEAATSDHGWDLARDGPRLKPIIDQLKSYGCRVALFMDSIPEAIDRAAQLGADRIELYTAPYAEDFAAGKTRAAEPYAITARRATELGLGVNAGHDLNLKNLPPLLKAIPNLLEVSIGHAFIADALEFGLAGATKKYLAVLGGDGL
jgi:pyridoxine 5-phosphate synthase